MKRILLLLIVAAILTGCSCNYRTGRQSVDEIEFKSREFNLLQNRDQNIHMTSDGALGVDAPSSLTLSAVTSSDNADAVLAIGEMRMLTQHLAELALEIEKMKAGIPSLPVNDDGEEDEEDDEEWEW